MHVCLHWCLKAEGQPLEYSQLGNSQYSPHCSLHCTMLGLPSPVAELSHQPTWDVLLPPVSRSHATARNAYRCIGRRSSTRPTPQYIPLSKAVSEDNTIKKVAFVYEKHACREQRLYCLKCKAIMHLSTLSLCGWSQISLSAVCWQ